MNQLNIILRTIAGTPWWVWVIFVYLLYIGLKATRERSVFLPKMFIIPLIFLSMKLPQLLTNPLAHSLWFVSAFAIGFIIAWFLLLRYTVIVNRAAMSITLPGSWSTLGLILVIFAVRYTFGYLDAAHPQMAKDLMHFKDLALGIISGFMWGKAISYACKLFTAKA